MKTKYIFIAFAIGLISFTSCKEAKKEQTTAPKKEEAKVELVKEVMTKEKQASLTPDDVIKGFIEGNRRFMNNNLTTRDHSTQVRKTTNGQFPKAVVLSCIDSRVPVEDIFDKGIGDIFVARVAGNFSNEDILGSMEYSCKVAGSKVVMVMGHEHCGAVKAAVKDVKLGNITPMLAKIKPAIGKVKYDGKKSYENKEYMHLVCESNVKNTINEIRKNSPILKEMEDKGEIKIVGGIYDLDDGKVTFIE